MNITVIAIGRNKSKDIQSIANEYLKRLPWNVKIFELESKEREEKRMKEDEGKLILSKISSADFVIALEEKGREFDSPKFAEYVQKLQLQGNSKIKFVIGGASGIAEEVRKRADLVLSLGKMTYPHQLARILLLEQLYRAWTILENRSYHK